jgi:hypothetical protein
VEVERAEDDGQVGVRRGELHRHFVRPARLALDDLVGSDFAFDAVAGSLWRLIENTTSAGVSGLPSWNVTPRRSLNTQLIASFVANSSAAQVAA